MTSPHDPPSFYLADSPADVANIPPRALMNLLVLHAEAVQRHAANRDEHALMALVLGTAIVSYVEDGRLQLVTAALQSGAPLDQVATACGMSVAVLRAEYATALQAEVHSGQVTAAEGELLLALIGGR